MERVAIFLSACALTALLAATTTWNGATTCHITPSLITSPTPVTRQIWREHLPFPSQRIYLSMLSFMWQKCWELKHAGLYIFNSLHMSSCLLNSTHHLRLDETGLHLSTEDQFPHLSSIFHLSEEQEATDGMAIILQHYREGHTATPHSACDLLWVCLCCIWGCTPFLFSSHYWE